jgi:hypothetical protein
MDTGGDTTADMTIALHGIHALERSDFLGLQPEVIL